MRTSKFLSTISYNSDDFLQNVLNSLINGKIVVFWAYIEHFPERGELKKHKHLLIQPNGLINTDTIFDLFDEPIPGNEKPLSVMPFRVSKVEDCLLYFLHDSKYLDKKMLKKKYHYELDDFKTSNDDYLRELYYTLDLSKYGGFDRLLENAKNGIPFSTLVNSGIVPIQQIRNYEHFYNLLLYENYTLPAKKDMVLFPVQNKFNF